MKMSKRAEKALRASIKHWEVDVLGDGTRPTIHNCPLCIMDEKHGEGDCMKCPLGDYEMWNCCSETPYTKYDSIYNYNRNTSAMKKQAKRMINLMKSLLPKRGEL